MMPGRSIQIACGLLVITLTGCPPKPMPPTDPPLPQLIDVRPRYRDPAKADPAHKGPITRLRITRLILPIDAKLTPAMNLLETQGLEPSMAKNWHANGLSAYMIHHRLIDDFIQLLPLKTDSPQLDHLEQRVINTSQMKTPLDFNLAFHTSVHCDITLPGEENKSVKLKPGRCRLLLQSYPDDDDASVLVDITPQHYFPRVSIFPRPIQESMLDGRVFDELVMQAKLNRRRVLVLTLHQPPKENDPDQPVTKPSLTLGHLLLAAQRYRKPIQFVLIIAIDTQTR